jgi:hypothetical protein
VIGNETKEGELSCGVCVRVSCLNGLDNQKSSLRPKDGTGGWSYRTSRMIQWVGSHVPLSEGKIPHCVFDAGYSTHLLFARPPHCHMNMHLGGF